MHYEFRDFIDVIGSASRDNKTLRKLTDFDFDKFFAKIDGRLLSLVEIQQRLPPQYRDKAAAFLPQDANTLPPHRLYDYKIELIPGSKLPAACNRPLSLYKLLLSRAGSMTT